MTSFIKSYRVDTSRFENPALVGIDRYTVKIKAPVGKVISCYHVMEGDIFVNIEHNDKYTNELVYTLVFVPNDFKLSLAGCTFINTVVYLRYAGMQSFVKDIFNVYEKDRISYTIR